MGGYPDREQSREPKQEARFSRSGRRARLLGRACEGAGSVGGTRRDEPTEGQRAQPVRVDARQLEEARDLFEVDAAHGTDWRPSALDLFDGSTWSSSDPDASQ